MAAAADPIALGKRYQQQLTQSVETLRERAVSFKQVAESTVNECKAKLEAQRELLQPRVDAYKVQVNDLETPVSPNVAPFLLKTYLWTSVCLAGFTVARVISGLLLHGIIGMVFDTLPAAALTFVALPAFVFMNLRKVQMSEAEREQVVLFASVAEGVLVGALLSERYVLIFGPPVVLLPLSMGLIAHFVGTKELVLGNRRAFLGALVSGAFVALFVFGLLFNLTFWYLVLSVNLCAAAAADLQLKLASIRRGDSSPQLEQWKTVVIMSIAFAIGHYTISTTKEGAAAALEDERRREASAAAAAAK